ncbi:MAG: primosomal protein N', partial [Erysipelotrichaceae bacterium]|nr:primosomal protein N' [Erysipelotrichaceae bacterium]
MYIVSVLIEHPVHALDTNFDYLSHDKVIPGVRVFIPFNRQKIIGYVEHVEETSLSKEELEKDAGFTYQYIQEVIDAEPLLNDELIELAKTMSKLTMSPRIACYQAMLPSSLKPASNKAVGIKTQLVVHIIKDGTPKTAKQQECLCYLKEHQDILLKDVPYSRALLDNLKKQGFIEIIDKEIYRQPKFMEHVEKKIVLTDDQRHVVQGIIATHNQTSLIHGVTGSGKTEVYLALASHYLLRGQCVIVLVPEIALTPMMVEVFKQRFGDQVAVLHSRLSQGEKYDEYRRIKRGEVHIVVGARSAVFAPLENIGLIILDEEHDASYKQETKPRYLTSQIARIRAQTHKANVVLGSATPSLESYSRCEIGAYQLFELPQRINQKPLPKVEIVDMIEESRKRNFSLFSTTLQEQLQKTIDEGNQAILLLNKRGYASFLQCRSCGEVIKCPHCDVTLTYHKDENKLKCHYCEYTTSPIHHCPKCGQNKMKLIGYGTQKIEEEISNTFQHAKIIRYDVDTTKQKNSHAKLLEQFRHHEANILLGTQMIAKGLDFEDVTFVGVLNADLSLNIPDFRASERTFQLLSQVAGRSGRGQKEGRVVIQTYNPEHYAITCAAQHDYKKFYQLEMNYRQKATYPPFCHMVSLLIQGKNEQAVNNASQHIKNYLDEHLNNVLILGPAHSMIYKMNDLYRLRILLKFKKDKEVYVALNALNDYYNKKQKGKVTVICD